MPSKVKYVPDALGVKLTSSRLVVAQRGHLGLFQRQRERTCRRSVEAGGAQRVGAGLRQRVGTDQRVERSAAVVIVGQFVAGAVEQVQIGVEVVRIFGCDNHVARLPGEHVILRAFAGRQLPLTVCVYSMWSMCCSMTLRL